MAIAAKEKFKKLAVGAQLSVDYPRQGETIDGVSYTFRISAPANVQKVEVAVDQGAWQPCRQSAGYWWFDWSGYDSGEHEITSRLVTAGGKPIIAEPHEFFVSLEKRPA